MAKSEPPRLSLIDEARNEVRVGPRSRIEAAMDEMAPDLRAEYVAAINDHTIPATSLARVLARRGITGISSNSIGHYRRTKAPLA